MTSNNKVLNFSLLCTALMLLCVIASGFFLVKWRVDDVLFCLSGVLLLRRFDKWHRKRHNQEEENKKKDTP